MAASFAFPFTCYVVLCSNGNELVGNGYTREAITFDMTDDDVTAANTSAVQWPEATGPWPVITEIWLRASAVGGTALGGPFTPLDQVSVPQYGRLRIPASAFVVTPGAGPSPYGVGTYGVGHYATYKQFYAAAGGILLLLTWGTVPHVCEPGAWTPGPFVETGWAGAGYACTPGTWTQGPVPA